MVTAVVTEGLSLTDAARRYVDVVLNIENIPFDARMILKREAFADLRAALEREEEHHEDS